MTKMVVSGIDATNVVEEKGVMALRLTKIVQVPSKNVIVIFTAVANLDGVDESPEEYCDLM